MKFKKLSWITSYRIELLEKKYTINVKKLLQEGNQYSERFNEIM